MFALQASDPCGGDLICSAVKWTHHKTWTQIVNGIIGLPLALAGLLVLGLLLRLVFHRLINRIVAGAQHSAHDVSTTSRRVQRAKTLGDLLKSIVTGILVAIIGTMMLSRLGLDIAPIIASAGIVGIALGFGAQSLVKDFLSGVFMIFEDQFGVGDVVDVGEASGTIEAVSLRVTRLRDVNGTVWYVPNGEILRVGNMSQNWARAVLDISVGYGEDLARVRRILAEVAHDLWDDDDFRGEIIEEPEVTGVESLAADGVTVRVMVKTLPMRQWAVARELRQRIKARFDHEGIEMPFPQRVVWQRNDGEPNGATTGDQPNPPNQPDPPDPPAQPAQPARRG